MNLPSSLLYEYYIALTRIEMKEIADMKEALAKGQVDEKQWKQRLGDEVLAVLGRL